ncbi:Prophage PSPPH02, putative adenine modification methytransferase, partial [Pseudomonas coronafaciens pv. oryzae]
DIRKVFDGFHFELVDIRYTPSNQRQPKSVVSRELVIMNWEPSAFGGFF